MKGAFLKKIMEKLTEVSEITISYKPIIGEKPIVNSSDSAYKEILPFFPEELISLQEMFVVMYLNNAGYVIGVYKVSTGGITGTVADPRLILATALKVAATSMIISHNHPSSNMKPSTADISLTKKLKEAGSFMDIMLTDHIIISPEKGSYFSFMDEGMI